MVKKLFSGKCFYVELVKTSEQNRLEIIIKEHGGKVFKLTAKTLTHAVLDPHAKQSIAEKCSALKCVTPTWVDRCITDEKLLPEKDYPVGKQTGDNKENQPNNKQGSPQRDTPHSPALLPPTPATPATLPPLPFTPIPTLATNEEIFDSQPSLSARKDTKVSNIHDASFCSEDFLTPSFITTNKSMLSSPQVGNSSQLSQFDSPYMNNSLEISGSFDVQSMLQPTSVPSPLQPPDSPIMGYSDSEKEKEDKEEEEKKQKEQQEKKEREQKEKKQQEKKDKKAKEEKEKKDNEQKAKGEKGEKGKQDKKEVLKKEEEVQLEEQDSEDERATKKGRGKATKKQQKEADNKKQTTQAKKGKKTEDDANTDDLLAKKKETKEQAKEKANKEKKAKETAEKEKAQKEKEDQEKAEKEKAEKAKVEKAKAKAQLEEEKKKELKTKGKAVQEAKEKPNTKKNGKEGKTLVKRDSSSILSDDELVAPKQSPKKKKRLVIQDSAEEEDKKEEKEVKKVKTKGQGKAEDVKATKKAEKVVEKDVEEKRESEEEESEKEEPRKGKSTRSKPKPKITDKKETTKGKPKNKEEKEGGKTKKRKATEDDDEPDEKDSASPKKAKMEKALEETPARTPKPKPKKGTADAEARSEKGITKCILLTRNSTASQDEARKAANKFSDCRLVDNTTDDVTHVVLCGEGFTGKTYKALWGIAHGLWVVDSKWLLESASAGKWKPEEKYEATSRLSGTNTSRLSHKKSGFKNLFEGVAFYHKHSQIERSEFDDLVRSCGGSVVRALAKADVIIDDEKKTKTNTIKPIVSSKWFTDCIAQWTVVDKAGYN